MAPPSISLARQAVTPNRGEGDGGGLWDLWSIYRRLHEYFGWQVESHKVGESTMGDLGDETAAADGWSSGLRGFTAVNEESHYGILLD